MIKYVDDNIFNEESLNSNKFYKIFRMKPNSNIEEIYCLLIKFINQL